MDRIIVEINDSRLQPAVALAQRMAQQSCFLKMGQEGIDMLVADLFTEEGIPFGDRLSRVNDAFRLAGAFRGRFFFGAEGLRNPSRILDICTRYKAKAVSVDQSIWKKFFPRWHAVKSDVPIYGSFDAESASDFHGHPNMHVALHLAYKLTVEYGANGFITNTLDEGKNIRYNGIDGLAVICRITKEELLERNTIRNALENGIDAFIIDETIANDEHAMASLTEEVGLEIRR